MIKTKNVRYIHSIGDGILKVEIWEGNFQQLLYKNKINIRDKAQMNLFLSVLENYGNFSISEILKLRMTGDWI